MERSESNLGCSASMRGLQDCNSAKSVSTWARPVNNAATWASTLDCSENMPEKLENKSVTSEST